MKNPLPVVFLAILSALSPCLGVPETLELADGRKLEQVTAAVPEHGKIKVTHSGGVMRISPADFTAESRKALGLAGGENSPAPVPEITRLETTKGEVYEGIRSVRVSPVAISFVYRDGAASVRFDAMPENLRAAFHYDPQLAATFDREENARRDMQARKERQAELAEANAKARAEACQMARENAFWDAVVKRNEHSMELTRAYGPDLGGYIDRHEAGWQRDADLRAASRAKALHGR